MQSKGTKRTISGAGLLLSAVLVLGQGSQAQSAGTSQRNPNLNDGSNSPPPAQSQSTAPGHSAGADDKSGSQNVAVATPSGSAETAQTPPENKAKPHIDIYGFAQMDIGYDFRVNDPNWFDVNRPSKLPSVPGEFGKNGNTFASVRQTRFGVTGSEPTSLGELKFKVEFDMFGVGIDAGQTTIRPRHYYGEIGPILAGQTNSVFMDVDVFPNVLDYWGPAGMVFLRNPQVRWTPINGNTILMFALEKPGASGDAGAIADRIDLSNVKGRFQWPDFTAAVKHSFSKVTYLRLGGVVRSIKIDNLTTNNTQSIVGWGVNISSNIRIHKDVLRLQYTYGNGIENYMNDAPVDVAPIVNPGNLVQPFRGRAIPVRSFSAYLDHSWSDRWTTAIGYSPLWMSNTSLQLPDAFHGGQYASFNILCTPFKNFLTGGEFQYGRRTNLSNGFNANDYRLEFSFKYTFNFRVLGDKT